MKKILLASAATAAMTAAAYADGHETGVTVTGDGRMGLVYNDADPDEFGFSSRIRIKFAASGQTDSGLAFGGSVRADNAGGELSGQNVTFVDTDGDGVVDPGEIVSDGNTFSGGGDIGTAGSVFISGEFGKLSMGDVDGAAKAAVGHVDGVGYTGLQDFNESTFLANAGNDPSALYEYDAGDFGAKFSIGNPGQGDPAIALGLTYSFGDIKLSAGYEDDGGALDHIIVGADASFGDVTVKGRFGTADPGDQFALSATYSGGGTSISAFYTDDSDLGGVEALGIGAAYDLGGGASLKGGFADVDGGATVADFGMTFDF